MTPASPRALSRLRLALLAAALLPIAVAVTLMAAAPGLIARRIHTTAAGRGLEASWRSLRLRAPLGITLRGLTFTRARADTAIRIDSLEIDVDAGSLLALAPRPSRVSAAGVMISARALRPESADTLALAPRIAPGRLRADQLPRIRRAARRLARLLALPPERLPRLRLVDLTLRPDAEVEEGGETLVIERLELAPGPGGSRLYARGETRLEHPVPFEARLDYGQGGGLAGRAAFDFGGGPGDSLTLEIAARVVRTTAPAAVRLAPGSRIVVGTIPIELSGEMSTAGPRVRLALGARDVRAADVRASVPAPLLGPLTQVRVTGTFDYALSFDLDLERPDSLAFDADVVPHALGLDSAGTTLRLAGLREPFTATIHLPRGRLVTRDLKDSNPHFRTLERIDSTLALAVVINEDGGFFRHHGFNTDAVKQAFAENLHAGAYRRGAGTITMQLARNLYLGHERTLSRKAQEVVLAWILEHLSGVSKRRLLEIYLNIIEWGPEVHGADEAAHYYFGHDAGTLSVAEALFLATVVPAPAKWRYRFDAAGGLRRFEQAQMHFIGRAMINKGWLAPEQLPPGDSLRVELRGPARDVLFPRAVSSAVRARATAVPAGGRP